MESQNYCEKQDCYCHVFVQESRKCSIITGAIKSLTQFVRDFNGKTCTGLMHEVVPACQHLQEVAKKSWLLEGKTVLTLKAVCAIFQRCI